VSLIVGAFPQAGVAEWLAGVAACQHVDGLNGREVHRCHVAVVGYVGVVVGKDAGGRLVVLDVPRDLGAQHRADGHVQAAVAGEE
jgi:hypothetical protein